VAEHAVLHVAVENVSRLAADAVVGARLASFTEKSTRFQVLERDYIYTPVTIASSDLAHEYTEIHDVLYQVYARALQAVGRLVEIEHPRRGDEKEGVYKARVGKTTVDLCRFIIPASALSNFGMTINARETEWMVTKMLSHRLKEVRSLGQDVKLVAVAETPTLVKYADRNDYLVERETKMTKLRSEKRFDGRMWPTVELVDHTPDAELKVIAGLLYQVSGGTSYKECYQDAILMTEGQRIDLLDSVYGGMGLHDRFLREMELGDVIFDTLIDWADYRDFWRNRQQTNLPQIMDGSYGVAVPKKVDDVGLGEDVRKVFKEAFDLADLMKTKFGEDEYLYVYPGGTMRRLLMKMNLRQFFEAFYPTRSNVNTNPGYQFLALQMGEIVSKLYPSLWKFISSRIQRPTSQEVAAGFYGGEYGNSGTG